VPLPILSLPRAPTGPLPPSCPYRSSPSLVPQERAVFFDLIGCGMITYPDSLAALLHTVPLALFLMLPLASVAGVSTGWLAGRAK
jgi:hypothetical protein